MYVALDLETTGLDSDRHQVLEFGAVFNDFTKPVRKCDIYREAVDPGGDIVGNAFALQMNAKLLREIATTACPILEDVLIGFSTWLRAHGIGRDLKATLVGKNIGSFDVQFLNRVRYWPGEWLSYRYLDVGSQWATTEGISGQAKLCKEVAERHGLVGVEHTAVYDAQVSLALAREKWFNDDNYDYEWLL